MQLNRQFILLVTLVIGLSGCDLSSVIEPQLPSQTYNEQTRHQLAISMQHSDPTKRLVFAQSVINKKFGDFSFSNPLSNPFTKGRLHYQLADPAIASIDSQGEITLHGIGTTQVVAQLKDDNNQSIAAANFWLSVNQAPQQSLFFEMHAMNKSIHESRFANPLFGGSGQGKIVFNSSNPQVAKVDRHSGEVELIAPGIAVIQASKSWDRYFLAANAQYMLSVSQATNKADVVAQRAP